MKKRNRCFQFHLAGLLIVVTAVAVNLSLIRIGLSAPIAAICNISLSAMWVARHRFQVRLIDAASIATVGGMFASSLMTVVLYGVYWASPQLAGMRLENLIFGVVVDGLGGGACGFIVAVVYAATMNPHAPLTRARPLCGVTAW